MKTVADIKFIKSMKPSKVITTFANVNLSTQYGGYKLKKLARIIMENGLQCKHQERKLKKETLQLQKKLRLRLNMVIYHTLLHQRNIVVKSKLKAISK